MKRRELNRENKRVIDYKIIFIEKEAIRNKVKAMSRMMKMFKTLREESENVVQLKEMSSDGKVPLGLLLDGKEALKSELEDRSGLFQSVKKLDVMNEAMPN